MRDLLAIIDEAILIEGDGIEFYKNLVNRTTNNMARMIFQEFLKDEVLHKKKFLDFRLALSDDASSIFEYSLESFDIPIFSNLDKDIEYVKKAKRAVFGKNVNLTVPDALRIGLKTEEQSIQYYINSARKLKENEGIKDRQFIEGLRFILMEEIIHYHTIKKMNDEFKQFGFWIDREDAITFKKTEEQEARKLVTGFLKDIPLEVGMQDFADSLVSVELE